MDGMSAEFRAELEALRKEYEQRLMEAAQRELARIFARANAAAVAQGESTKQTIN